MDDLISRQAAIDVLSFEKEILSRALDDMYVVGAEREKYSFALGLIESNIKDIEELPTAQPEQRWIPVTEKLPDDGAEVWVTTEMLSEVTRARWHKDSMLWCHPYHSDCLLVLRPIAWMNVSVPEPWKGENDG